MASIYFRPFEVLDRIGLVTYRITFSTNTKANNVFLISFLNKYIHDVTHVIDWYFIYVETKREFQIEPLHILNNKVTLFWI